MRWDELQDYEVVQELWQLRHSDQSAAFWQEDAKIFPDYKTRGERLKEYALLTLLYRWARLAVNIHEAGHSEIYQKGQKGVHRCGVAYTDRRDDFVWFFRFGERDSVSAFCRLHCLLRCADCFVSGLSQVCFVI